MAADRPPTTRGQVVLCVLAAIGVVGMAYLIWHRAEYGRHQLIQGNPPGHVAPK